MSELTIEQEADKTISRSVIHARIKELSTMDKVDYNRIRKGEASKLGINVLDLDAEVKREKKEQSKTNSSYEDDAMPWDEPVNASELFGDIADTIARFIVCDEETITAATLWVAMTWFMEALQVAPLAVITAPEKRCGKSQLLFVLSELVFRPIPVSNITPAALFRVIDAWTPTLLIDEADTFMRENEEIRGILNGGHTRGAAFTYRLVGDAHEPKKFNIWGAKAVAGIGKLSDTLMDRSIVLPLRRKLSHEKAERMRHAENGLFDTLKSKLARLSLDAQDDVRFCHPTLPEQLNDRAQDNWESLLKVAELGGADWIDKAVKAALKLSGESVSPATVGIQLLSDARDAFDEFQTPNIFTKDLIDHLCKDEEKPWCVFYNGKPIKPFQISNLLREYEIRSHSVRVGSSNKKGYRREDFDDAFNRYLSSLPLTP